MGDDRGDEEKTFGEVIRRLRGERGLTQRDVAERLGINFTYLSKLENDRGERPGEETVRKLAEILRADAEELMVRAHERCPYSNATRGNVDVTLTVDGIPLERAAA